MLRVNARPKDYSTIIKKRSLPPMSRQSVLKSLPKSRGDLFSSFAKTYVDALQDEDFTDHPDAALASMVEGVWSIGRRRAENETLTATAVVAGRHKGWLHERTRLYVVSPDRAFIIDSVTAELNRRNLVIRTLLHPVLSFVRDNKGVITAAGPRDGKDGTNESWLVIEVQGAMSADARRQLEQDIQRVMGDVMLATRDWQGMRAELCDAITTLRKYKGPLNRKDPGTLDEYVAFLEYLHDNNFTLLGFREYKFQQKGDQIVSAIVPGRSLALLSDERAPVYINKSSIPLPQDLQQLRANAPLVSVYKVNRRSTVHRPVPLDAITVKMLDDKGRIVGEKLFVGLFTSVTYSRSIADLQLIRRKLRQVFDDVHFATDSHDFRALSHILEKYPRDELFQMPVEQIREHAIGILRLQDRPRVALYTRVDDFRRYVSCLVYVPRDRYETNLRVAIQTILEQELEGVCENFYTTLDDSPLARVMYIIATDQQSRRKYDFDAIEHKLVDASRTWTERLRHTLMERIPDEHRAIELAIGYDTAFPLSYRDHYPPATAVADIDKIEEAYAHHRIALDLHAVQSGEPGHMRLKLYHPGRAAVLSDVLPILENMGFRVEAEYPFELRPYEGVHAIWMHEFYLSLHCANLSAVDLESMRATAEDALMAVWYGQAESDPLNALVLSAGLDWRDVVILRAYTKYMQQARVSYTPAYIMKALVDHPMLSAALVGLFHARNDPALPASRRKVADWEKAISDGLESVALLDQDRIVRYIKTLVDATLRTNFYQRDSEGGHKPCLSMKLDSSVVAYLPEPRPWREIWVYSPRMEGIHLRGGRIARGGIRWSDRAEDFRTEILGLMQAQMVKNAVIVPEGAKGGFILKRLPEGSPREVVMNEGIECYRLLVRGMLDVTDNLTGDQVIPPVDTVRHDGDDPYLVVAADKGTATFSDIANALSGEYGFWLGDAFASGGSAGYDHKEIGITARGAWECIKRHFRELGTDIQEEPFDVVGVGDMAGDVFGNGMLLSKKIRLVGAFNHQHIFCDPNPDPDRTWKERERLFHGIKAWGDYDQKLLSKGGRIFSRSEKSLTLTKEIRERFGISAEKLSPPELIHAMLRAKCDLLYFGGIGTYIKAAGQTNIDVGDRANDTLRVDGAEINARVVGEGANLAVTRKARVEMGLKGIKLNADFIDNSGGVDCSDHEVNIKILLQDLTSGAKPVMTMKQRNTLLEAMTGEVAALVLRDNYHQSQAISMAELDAPEQLSTHARFIDVLEQKHKVKRSVENLPAATEIENRAAAHKGLTRSELATVICLAKIRVTKDLLATALPDDPLAEDWLMHYFPDPIRAKYVPAIRRHRLRREIIAAQMTASIVNRLGPTFMMTVMDKTGAEIEDIARAAFLVRESLKLRPLWYAIEALDGLAPARSQLKAMKQIAKLVESLTLWFLRFDVAALRSGTLADSSRKLGACIDTIVDALAGALPPKRRRRIEDQVLAWQEAGLPAELARMMAHLGPLRSSLDVCRIAGCDKKQIPTAATVFYHLGEDLHFDWLREQGRALSGASFWQAEAIDGVLGQLYATQAAISRRVLAETDAKKDPLSRLRAWKEKNVEALHGFDAILADMRRLSQLDLAMLTLAEQRLRQIAG